MYYLGVDGGGTKTAAVLADEQGRVLRQVKMGPGNIAVLDRGTLAQLIRNIVAELTAGLETRQLEWATFAFAGAGRAAEKETVRALIRGAGVQHFSVMTDAEILHYSVFGEEPGILISAGTGSICLLRDHAGQYHRIGGWGYLLGDEGSGFDIGSRAIRQALLDMESGREPSRLTRELLIFYGIDAPQKLISIVYSSISPARLIASCARLVCEMAAVGDENALNIVNGAVDELLKLVDRAISRFGENRSEPYRVSLTGGILKHNRFVRQQFQKKAQQRGYQFQYLEPEMEPAAAAVLYSLRKSGKNAPDTLMTALKSIRFS